MKDIFRGDVSGRSGNKWTAAKTSEGTVKPGHSGFQGGEDICHRHTAGIVEVQPPGTLRVGRAHMGAEVVDLIRNSFRVHEGADFDNFKSGVDETEKKSDFLMDGKQ